MVATTTSPTDPAPARHADPKDRHGKRYKRERSTFSIEDDEGSDDEPVIFSKRDDSSEKVC